MTIFAYRMMARLFNLILVPAPGARRARFACAASGACGGFGFALNAAATFDVCDRREVTNFDVLFASAAPNRSNYIDVCIHTRKSLPDRV
jgi:hypothetical protein